MLCIGSGGGAFFGCADAAGALGAADATELQESEFASLTLWFSSEVASYMVSEKTSMTI